MGWLQKAGKSIKKFGQDVQDVTKNTPLKPLGNLTKSVVTSVADPLKSARDAVTGTARAFGVDTPWKGSPESPTGGGAAVAAPEQPMPTIGEYKAAYGGGTYGAPSASVLGDESFQGISKIREVATNNPWLNLAKQRQGLEEQQLLGSAGKLAAQSARTAQSNLAMRGGLRSGASERMARQGALEQALAQQKVRSEGALTRAGYDVEGEKMRQGMLGTLASAEQGRAAYETGANQWNALQKAEAEKWGLEQGIQEGIRRGEYDKYKFGEEAKMYGAGKTADAIARSGGNQSFWNQINPFAKA